MLFKWFIALHSISFILICGLKNNDDKSYADLYVSKYIRLWYDLIPDDTFEYKNIMFLIQSQLYCEEIKLLLLLFTIYIIPGIKKSRDG